MCFKTYLNNEPIFSSTSGTPQYYPLLRFPDWNFVRILHGIRVCCILCTSVILIILHHLITLLTLGNERCMRLLIMHLYSSCCFLFRRALPRLRPLVADPWIRTPGFGTQCDTGTSFFLSTSGFLCHYYSTTFLLHTFHSPSKVKGIP